MLVDPQQLGKGEYDLFLVLRPTAMLYPDDCVTTSHPYET